MEQYKQKDGDTLEILGKSSKKDYCICKSLKYGNHFEAKKCHIINGCVCNPEKDNFEFIGKSFPQGCGDILLVIEKTNKQNTDKSYFYRCQFQKYPYEVLVSDKRKIKNGNIDNPQIEQIEFASKIWPQHCGDSLKIIKKEAPRKWKCQFILYPYEVIAEKSKILLGAVNNPRIEQETFIGREFRQNCGDILRIIEKTNKKDEGTNNYLYRCRFLNYTCDIFALKSNILKGSVDNPQLPWKEKKSLEAYIKNHYREKKPCLQELAQDLGIAVCTIGKKINEFNLRKYISYYENFEENNLRAFISQFTTCEEEEYYITDKNGRSFGIDVYTPSKKIGFEFNGTYWHSELFKDSMYHQRKSLAAKEQDINLIHIWEYEWIDPLKRPILESLIKSKLGIFKQKIGASKCKIKEISYKMYADFCNENHLQGEAGAKIKLGLFYQDKLVQVMSFGVPRFSDAYQWEIIRECSKLDTIVLGGKEKLWGYFIKKFNPKSVLSYCDYSKFTGESYIKLGFKKERLNKPGFVWYNEKERITYWRTPSKNSEYKKKYIKVFDCGQLVFGWHSL